jgi:Protein of unknown function (DUF1566)
MPTRRSSPLHQYGQGCAAVLVLLLNGCLDWKPRASNGDDDAGADRDASEPADGPSAPGDGRSEDAAMDSAPDPARDAAVEPPEDAGGAGAQPTQDGATDAGACPQSACPDVFPCEGTAEAFICRGQYAEFPLPSRRAGDNYADQKLVVDTAVGVALDQTSGLMWPRNVFVTPITHADAVQYCEGLVLGPYDDFRLPSLHEYLTLFGAELAPDVDQRVFPGSATTFGWWSSTPFVDAAEQSFYAMAYTEYAFSARAPDDRQGAHCVRTDFRPLDVRDTPATRFVPMADGALIRDPHTGLVWERDLALARSQLNYGQADMYCKALTTGGLSFRIPTLAEQNSIMDYSAPVGRRFREPFSQRATVMWTRTAVPDSDGAARVWRLQEAGWLESAAKDDSEQQAGVRCVSGGL